MNTKC